MKKLLSYLAPGAVLLLASCSTEPSDWRPENKVSLDLVAPGTRASDNYDQATDAAPNQAKGAAITELVSSGTRLEKRPAPTASGVMSADTQGGTAGRPGEGKATNERLSGDSPAADTAQGQAGARRK